MKKHFLILFSLILSVASLAAQEKTTIIDSLYINAVKARDNGDYQKAYEDMSRVRDMAGNNESTRNDAIRFLERIDKFEINPKLLNIPSIGDFQELTILAVGEWKCDTIPTWCHIEEMSKTYLKIWCEPNVEPVSRSGYIVLANENGKQKEVLVQQDLGKEKSGLVLFRTAPHNTQLETIGQSGYSSTPLELGVGEHHISISKSGYIQKDTVLVIETLSDTTLVVDVTLQPEFGKIKPVVLDENGNQWLSSELDKLTFTIRHHVIDISDFANSHSYDGKENVQYYGLYRDGTIPLQPASYSIEVSAPGYNTYTTAVDVRAAQTHEVVIPMESIMGKLILKAEDKNAEGAMVSIPELYLRARVGETLEVPEGTYEIRVYKDGYKCDNEIKNITIKEGKTTVYEVMMTRQVDMFVSVEGGGEEIYLNGKRVRDSHIKLNDGEDYSLEVRKDEHWHFVREFRVTDKDTLFNFRNLKLEKTGVLNLKSDEKKLAVSLKRKKTIDGIVDISDFDYSEGKIILEPKTEYSFVIPQGKYEVILTRTDIDSSKKKNKLAYKGTINFNEPSESKSLRTWMMPRVKSMSLLNIDYSLMTESELALGKLPIPIRANFIDVPLAKGLSTSLAEGAMLYTYNCTDFPADLPQDHYKVIMPAISGPLMNYDFRIGGGFCQWGDISALLSYTYYLQFENLIKNAASKLKSSYYGTFDHFEGSDWFLGLEVSTRLKYLTGYVRAGFQHLSGNRCYTYSIPVDNFDDEAGYYQDYISKVAMIPTKQTSFIVTVGLNFGNTKGQNILRIF